MAIQAGHGQIEAERINFQNAYDRATGWGEKRGKSAAFRFQQRAGAQKTEKLRRPRSSEPKS
jgi:hypothetical protein